MEGSVSAVCVQTWELTVNTRHGKQKQSGAVIWIPPHCVMLCVKNQEYGGRVKPQAHCTTCYLERKTARTEIALQQFVSSKKVA
jgi:hypothetical protein